jgi:hypothetical protein
VLRIVALALVTVTLGVTPAHAEWRGAYYVESFGVGVAGGDLGATVGTALHARLGVGLRSRLFAVEPWIGSNLQLDRTGAWRGLVGGEPAMGTADLAAMGVDLKFFIPIRGPIEAYVRGGASSVEGTGALEGYRGHGLGLAGGISISGKVRALGLLWAPLLFSKRGPLVRGTLLLDVGADAYQLRGAGSALGGRVAHAGLGLAIGAPF